MPVIEISSELDLVHPSPVWAPIPDGLVLPDGPLQLREEGSGRVVPAQREGDHLVAVLSGLGVGAKPRLHVETAPAAAANAKVTLKEEGAQALAIVLPEGPFTVYNFDPAIARPFFYPVFGPGGKPVTRNYPMKDLPEEKEAKDHDHPHHRSFWTAYGEVNGVDDWSEGAKHGWIKHQKFLDRKEGSVFGGFTAASVWTSAEGKPVLDERRTIRVYDAGPERRLLDYDVALIAAYEDVHYGDTKEAGILSFRVASTMKGSKGGRMENSNGGVTEAQCWGKKAAWLDYSGPVDGQVLGIAMMDHPGNFHHPCYWHARDYGLVGTNPFSIGSFEKGGPMTGTHQQKGETLTFRYRVLIHKGNAKEGRVDEAFHTWVLPGAKTG